MTTKILFILILLTSIDCNYDCYNQVNNNLYEPFASLDLEKLNHIENDYSTKEISLKNLCEPKDCEPNSGADYLDSQMITFHQDTSFDMITYFQNLIDYSPKNNLGSCGYVSLIQTMSFYDTFYNDSIVPEVFDRFYSFASSESDVRQHSPGTLRLQYYGSGYSSYYDFCHATQSYCFESYLTVLPTMFL